MNSTRERRVAAVERYVHDLAIALADLPTDEREEVIAGIREHIDDALASTAGDDPDAVELVLANLGDPAEIAADARGRQKAPVLPPPPPPQSHSATSRPPSTASPSRPAGESANPSLLTHELLPAVTMMLFVFAAALSWMDGRIASPFAILIWLGGLGLLIASPLWRMTEKFIGAMWFGLAPLAFVGLFGIGLGVGLGRYIPDAYGAWEVAGPGWDLVQLFALTGFIVTLVLMAWLVSVGSKRATAKRSG